MSRLHHLITRPCLELYFVRKHCQSLFYEKILLSILYSIGFIFGNCTSSLFLVTHFADISNEFAKFNVFSFVN
jgi:hypothetical protein